MSKKTNSYSFMYVLLIFLFHLINNIIIVRRDTVPLFFDEGGFYNLSVVYYRYLFASMKITRIFHHFHSISTFYPPLAFIAKIPFFAILGVSQDTSVLANSLFLFLFIYFTFLLGKYLFDGKTGILAAFLVSFYPAVYGFSRTNFLTIPMAASVAMSLYYLLRTESFSNRKFSILFGISIAFGLLIKWLYLIYLIPAMFVCVIGFFSNGKEKISRAALKNILVATTVAFVLILPWYLPNIKNLIPIILSSSYDNPNWQYFTSFIIKNPFRLGIFKQALMIEQYQLFSFYFLLFAYFFVQYIILQRNDLKKSIVLFSLIVPYLVFNFAIVEYYSGELCPRYTIPLFVIMAVITAKGVFGLKNDSVRRFLIVSIVLIGLTQLYWTWISYGKGSARFVFGKEEFQRYTTRGLLSPKTVDWKLAEIMNTIRDYRVSDKINMMIIPHTPLTSALDYYLQLNNPGEIVFPLNATFLGQEYISPPVEKYREEIEKCEFVLSQEGESFSYDAQSKWIADSIVSLTTAFEGVKNKFSLIKTVNICDGKPNILIYRKNNWSVKDIKQPSGNQEPAGEGLLIRAVDFSEGNLVYNQEFGLLIDGGVSPAYVSYDIILPYDGHYEVWAKYATRDFRPVEIYFDGSLIKSNGLTKFTQGWTYFESSWFKELELDADRGRHLLKLIAKTTPFPHLDSVKIIYKIKKRF